VHCAKQTAVSQDVIPDAVICRSGLLIIMLQAQLITVYPDQQTATQPDVPPACVAKLFPGLTPGHTQAVQLRFTVDGDNSTPAATGYWWPAQHAPRC
jgi:hypothetical protein